MVATRATTTMIRTLALTCGGLQVVPEVPPDQVLQD